MTVATKLDAAVLAELARPFSLAAVRFKPLTNAGSDGKVAVAFYIDARLAAERLNAVVGPEGWNDSYRLIAEANPAACASWFFPVECTLTVLGSTKVDVGVYQRATADDKTLKAAYSDAFKRAAVKFRVGAFLYAIPRLRAEANIRNEKVQGLTAAGETYMKMAYTRWLANPKVNRFGDALDHGDVIDEEHADETA